MIYNRYIHHPCNFSPAKAEPAAASGASINQALGSQDKDYLVPTPQVIDSCRLLISISVVRTRVAIICLEKVLSCELIQVCYLSCCASEAFETKPIDKLQVTSYTSRSTSPE